MALDPIVITLAIAGAALVLFIAELVPPYVTALATAAALMLAGVLDSEEGLSGFSNAATVTVLALFIVAAGVQRTGLVQVLAHKMLDWTAHDANRFLVLLVIVAGLISAFVANTPVVAIFIPLAITVAARLKRSPSKFLMPLSHAAVLGGMLTLIGTSTSILGSGLSEELGYGEFSMFMFTKVGAVVFVVGIAYLVLVGRHLLPERHTAGSVAERFDLQDYLCEVIIQPDSRLVGESVDSAHVRRRFNIDVIRIFRGSATFDQPLIGVELAAGDVLLVRGSRDALVGLREGQGLSILPEVTHGLQGEAGDVVLVEAVVAPGASFEGASLAESQFRQRYGAVVLGIKKREWFFLPRMHALALDPGDTLLFATTQASLDALKGNHEFIIAQELAEEKYRRGHIPVALLILAAVVAVAGVGWYPIEVTALAGAVLMFATGCLKVHELHEAVRLDIVFLLAGLVPLGIALQKTGAAAMLAAYLAGSAHLLPPIGVLALVYLITMVLTEFMSNNAAIVLMLPIAVNVADVLGLAPLTFIIAVVFASSLAFMTPMGYQTNLMVYGPGEYKFTDYLRVGTPLNVLTMIVSVYLIGHWWPLTP